MPCVTRLRRICSKNRSGILPSAASLLHGTGPLAESWASCSVALTAYETVRESFMLKIHSWTFAPAPAFLQADLSNCPNRLSCGAQAAIVRVLASESQQ